MADIYPPTSPEASGVKYKEHEILEEHQRRLGEYKHPEHRAPRVHVVIPRMGSMAPDLETLVIRLVNGDVPTFGAEVTVDVARHISPRDFMRNFTIEEKFMPSGADYLYYIDSDLVPSTNFMKLIEHKKEVVSGVYLMYGTSTKTFEQDGVTRNVAIAKLHPCAFVISEHEISEEERVWEEPYWFNPVMELRPDQGIIPIDMAGTGCLLIHRSVFERVRWTLPVPKKGRMPSYMMNRYRSDGAEGITEDVDFAYKMNKLGIKQWLDPSVQCAHFKEMNLNEVHLYGNQRAGEARNLAEAEYAPKVKALFEENEQLRMKLLMKSGRRPKTPPKKLIIAPN